MTDERPSTTDIAVDTRDEATDDRGEAERPDAQGDAERAEVQAESDRPEAQSETQTFRHERENLESQWSRGDNVSTEDLRVGLQRYRSFFERLLAT